MAMVFSTNKQAKAYAKKKNKSARKFKYSVIAYPKSQGGNGRKIVVIKRKK
jgi:hypothetical protein